MVKQWILAGMALVATAVGAAPDMAPGQWESVVRLKTGESVLPIPLFESTKCLGADNLIPNTVQAEQRCEVSAPRISGDEVAWEVRCRDERGFMEGQGRITYQGERYEGDMELTIRDNRQDRTAEITYALEGERIGRCTAD